METKANYILIGAFTLVISVALLLFGLWAAKYSSERSWQQYQIVFDEAVTGLSVGSPVQYNGIAIGSKALQDRAQLPGLARTGQARPRPWAASHRESRTCGCAACSMMLRAWTFSGWPKTSATPCSVITAEC